MGFQSCAVIAAAFAVAVPASGSEQLSESTVRAVPAMNLVVAGRTRIEIGGHRAGVDQAPENTLSAIRTAIDSGADAVELDVRFTGDGWPVILHDETLDRTTNCAGRIDAWKLSALTRCDAGSWFSRAFADEPVPHLGTVLDELRDSDLTVYLHVKLAENLTQALSLVSTVALHRMLDRVVFAADSEDRLARLAAAGVPEGRLAWVFHTAAGWRAEHGRWRILIPHGAPVTRSLVDRAHARGQRVIAVENYPVPIRDTAQLGLDGFLADRLRRALAVRDER